MKNKYEYYDNIYNSLQNDICTDRLMCMKKYLKKFDRLIDAYNKIKEETISLHTRDLYWQKTFRLTNLAEMKMGLPKYKKQIQEKIKKINI